MDVFTFIVICTEIPVCQTAVLDQMLHSAASELGLHYLHIYPKQASSLQRANEKV